MASKLSLLYHTSLEIINTYGLSYFLRIAVYELKKQKFDLFRNPTLDYFSELESRIDSQEELYNRYIENFDLEISRNISQNKEDTLKIKPKFTLVVLTNTKNFEYINRTVQTIKEQIYDNYEILLLSDTTLDDSDLNNKKENLQDVTCHTKLSDIQKNSNGDFICFVQSGDKLSRNALFKIVQLINTKPDSELIYTDHDFYDENNSRRDPFFKPDWSPFLFQSLDYLSTFFIVKKEIFDQTSFDDHSTAMAYYITRKITEKSKEISHLQLPICSINYDYIFYKQKSENKINSKLEKKAIIHNSHSISPPKLETNFKNEPLVTIIIPTKNNYKILKRCLDSINQSTLYKNFEIIVVDNDSGDELKQYYNSLKCTVLNFNGNFNFSKMNNYAVKHAKGDFLLFLNDDTKVLERNWLHKLVSVCNQNGVGAVGPKLLFSNNTIQHAGSVILETGASFHPFQHIFYNSNLHFNFLNVTRECSAVTGACLITKKEVFDRIDGFDDDFDVYYGDTDLCLKIINSGLSVLYTPNVKLLHEGSHSIKSKMNNNTLEKNQAHFAVENYYRFINKWPKLKNGDPFYNRNLGWDFSIKSVE